MELCRRLDGIPLALELAAARSAILAPRALLDRIGTALDLGAGATDLPARQRTLRDTLAWSQQLLSSAQSALLARLSVFAAPWTLSDADGVAHDSAGDVLDEVAVLVENNLVVPAPDAPGEPRFRLYETVRAYASELLDEAAREQTEAAYVARLTRQGAVLSARIRSSDHEPWMAEFQLWPDVRRAWELALKREDAESTCLASMSLVPLWLNGRVLEAYDLVEASIRLADEAQPRRHGDLVVVATQALYHLGNYDRAGELVDRLERDVPAPRDPDMVGAVPILRGLIALAEGDLDGSEQELRRSVELLESEKSASTGWLDAYAHTGVGTVLALRGDIDGAIRELTVARELGRDFGNVGAEMESHVFEADLHLASGRRDKARELLESACALVELRPFYEGNAYCLEEVAAYAAGGGNTTDAARLLGLAQALRDVLGTRSWALLKPLTERIHDAVRSASHASSFDAAYAEGRTLDPRSGAALCRTALALPVAPPGNVATERT